MLASEVLERRVNCMRGFWHWRWHFDEVFVTINGEIHYLWRAAERITTDGLKSYRAAIKDMGNSDLQEIGKRAINRVKNSHLLFRRRERAMLRLSQPARRPTHTLQLARNPR